MKYEIVELEEKVVAGIKIKTTNKEGKAVHDIGITWQKLFANEIYKEIQNKVNNKTIGLYTEYEGDYTKPYIFLAGAEVSQSGESNKEITRVASFCGAGVDENSIAFAKAQGVDVIVSSDFKHHLLALALESGLAVVILPHYASEHYGFEKYYKKIRQQLDIPCIYHTDTILL